ncbi:acetylglutamate kinase [Helicobacter saguini]|uniref:Acetylglutamate kinase n=1 Tax=Helicobacter saguini TaxID=1548018 RepID=A0A347VS02_9HELI|nr:acetylglutamate kinase [Helicobacter saguini]MWV62706.1 acetylglutamate kinase [Helicobacter saguini]MWV66623.1 acetylglutamate kinase [Helicobacter saguini]MWV68973.1 acetylglutamate kinase [Helicobacter saguini]MWV71474.1 acetylglutamate kinase [Helicobacter saguini]TLD94118.1 acetylglutamate kinase [Helicobacter saguini]
MKKLQDKAKILIEALPYIQHFRGKVIIIKYGGSAMESEKLKKSLIRDVALLQSIGFKPIIVHGGGKEIDKWLKIAQIERIFKDGLRVTDLPTMEIVEMVLNKISKELVGLLSEFGVKSCGLSGKDGKILQVEPKDREILGFVGRVVSVDSTLINAVLNSDFVPVICPVGIGIDHRSYNINADDAACALAEALRVEKLVFLSDIEGVYRDYNDKSSLISELSIAEAQKLISDGSINGGMIPKINSCIHAVRNGVSRVHIIDGRIEHCLLLEFFTNRGIGTAILNG